MMNKDKKTSAARMWKQYYDFKQQRIKAENALLVARENETAAYHEATLAQERENSESK